MCLQGQDTAVLPVLVWHHPHGSVCPQPAALQCALLQPQAGEVMEGRKDRQQDACQLQEWLSSAQAALDSSLPSPKSGSKPQLKQYRKTGKENKLERLLFPRSHTLFVGCSEAGKEHSEGVFTAHPAWDGMLEACELHRGRVPRLQGLVLAGKALLPAPRQTTAGQITPPHKHKSSTYCLVPDLKATGPSNPG